MGTSYGDMYQMVHGSHAEIPSYDSHKWGLSIQQAIDKILKPYNLGVKVYKLYNAEFVGEFKPLECECKDCHCFEEHNPKCFYVPVKKKRDLERKLKKEKNEETRQEIQNKLKGTCVC